MTENFEKYLETVNFKKQFYNLCRKLKNKRVVIYGCGQLFDFIYNNYDLSNLNIIGVSDLKFTEKQENETYLGYKIILKSKIQSENPDYVLIASMQYVSVIKNFDINVKLKPLVRKSFLDVLKEIWS